MRVRVQNGDAKWLRKDRTWSEHREEAAVYASIAEAEGELRKLMHDALGQIVFEVGER